MNVLYFWLAGAEPRPIIRDSARPAPRVIRLPLPRGLGQLAALRPAVRAAPHLCVRHCHLVEGWYREPSSGRTARRVSSGQIRLISWWQPMDRVFKFPCPMDLFCWLSCPCLPLLQVLCIQPACGSTSRAAWWWTSARRLASEAYS